jgi:hypothetical protein
MPKKIVVCSGLSFPFFPMRPVETRHMLTHRDAEEVRRAMLEHEYLVQPKLNGDRACLAVVERRVWVQNRHGSWYGFQVSNANDYLRYLPDGTALDGEVYEGNFYPFELLALKEHSFLMASAAEREVMGFQMCKKAQQPWMFRQPSLKWLRELSAHLPRYEGVVMKEYNSPYIKAGNANQENFHWMKRKWPKPQKRHARIPARKR